MLFAWDVVGPPKALPCHQLNRYRVQKVSSGTELDHPQLLLPGSRFDEPSIWTVASQHEHSSVVLPCCTIQTKVVEYSACNQLINQYKPKQIN